MREVIIPLTVSPNFLWAVVGFMALIFAVMSIVYVYHWQYYGVEGNHRVFAKSLFFVVGILLLFLMVIFLGAYAYA